MAVRIHISATTASVTDVRQVFGEILGASFGSIPIESTGVWNFFTTSVWCVSRTKLCEGLARLNGPGLQATTEDAWRWYLTVFCPNRPPVTFLHEFHRFEHEFDPGEITEEPVNDEEEIDSHSCNPTPIRARNGRGRSSMTWRGTMRTCRYRLLMSFAHPSPE